MGAHRVVRAVKILMVTKFVPWPADSGGKRRSLAIAQELARVGDVTLCAFHDASSRPDELEQQGIRVRAVPWAPGPSKVIAGLAHTGSLTAARFWDRALHAEIEAAAGSDIDHLQIEYTQLAPYARGIAARRRVLDMHNVESALIASYARTRRGPAKALYLEAAALRRLEQRALADFDATAVVSHADARLLAAPGTVVSPNGWVPTDAPLPTATEPVAAFVALMGWAPNDDAAHWLCRSIWPLVRARVADAKLLLVGRDPSKSLRAHAGPGVEVTGTVPDVRPHLQRARVGLAPLRAGGGSRLKVLESLDAGRPVVATSKGVEGLEDLVGNGVVVADDPDQIAAAIADLLTDPERAEEIGLQGRAAVAERHSWQTTLRPLMDVVTGTSARRNGETS